MMCELQLLSLLRHVAASFFSSFLQDSIEAQLAEEGARAQRLSEMLQTSERVGCNIRQELTKVKASVVAVRCVP